MVTETVIARICELPVELKRTGDSPLALVQQSGYFAVSETLVPQDLERYIRSKPHLIDEWLGWSADKRCTGFYFLQTDEGKFVVGYYPGGVKHEYRDPYKACAKFIFEELAEFRLTPSQPA